MVNKDLQIMPNPTIKDAEKHPDGTYWPIGSDEKTAEWVKFTDENGKPIWLSVQKMSFEGQVMQRLDEMQATLERIEQKLSRPPLDP